MTQPDPKPPAVIELLGDVWAFHCPGCKQTHHFGPTWRRTGSLHNPTFSPSLITFLDGRRAPAGRICHLQVREGKIHYLADSWHGMRGSVVPMEPVG